MQIFLSYATEQKAVAEPIAFSLRARGHHVFLDKDDLPPGQTYDDQIQRAVVQSDVMIFLVSPASVTKGRYTRTELEFARAAWRHPANRVLPVMTEMTPMEDIPSFLKSVTILQPHGNVTAEVSVAVDALSTPPPFFRAAIMLASAGIASVALTYVLDTKYKANNSIQSSIKDIVTIFLTDERPKPTGFFDGFFLKSPAQTFIERWFSDAPMWVPLVWAIALVASLKVLKLTELKRAPVLVIFVFLGWIAAVQVFSLALTIDTTPYGIKIEKEDLSALPQAKRDSISTTISSHNSIVTEITLRFGNALAGFIGAAISLIGILLATRGSRLKYRPGELFAIAVAGGIAGAAQLPSVFYYLTWVPASVMAHVIPVLGLDTGRYILILTWQVLVGVTLAWVISRMRA